jgi:hypothetical protein
MPLLADCSPSSQQALLNSKKTDGFDELSLPSCYADEKNFPERAPRFFPLCASSGTVSCNSQRPSGVKIYKQAVHFSAVAYTL